MSSDGGWDKILEVEAFLENPRFTLYSSLLSSVSAPNTSHTLDKYKAGIWHGGDGVGGGQRKPYFHLRAEGTVEHLLRSNNVSSGEVLDSV